MSSEQTGRSRIARLVDRLFRLPVRLSRDEPAEGSITGTMGTVYERQAAFEKVHGSWAVEAFENPSRAARYLATGICSAHTGEPQKH